LNRTTLNRISAAHPEISGTKLWGGDYEKRVTSAKLCEEVTKDVGRLREKDRKSPCRSAAGADKR
jgi:hypothetical protein